MSEQVTWALIADIMDDVDGMGAGIPPRDLQAFSSESTEDGVLLKFTPPKPTYLNEHTSGDGKQFACMPGGVLIMYSEESYPRSPEEGKIACNYVPDGDWTTEQQTFEVTGLTKEHTYYFTAFPYSVNGVYNTNQIAENRTSMTWVGNSGTISVNVKTPKGYTGELGEYTITLLDQSADNPQNEQKTATGPGITLFGSLTGGKQYKVRLSSTDDLQAPADSEVLTVVAGDTVSVELTYAQKVGTITVNVSTQPANMPIGGYTVTLTPQSGGGEPLTAQGNNTQSVVFNNAINGVVYNVGLSSINHYTANTNGSVTAVGGQNTSHNVHYEYVAQTLEETSWSEIDAISQTGAANSIWSVGDTKTLSVNGENLTMEIVGFNHDTKSSGGYAGITFGMKYLSFLTMVMNYQKDCSGGFYESKMYEWLNSTVFNGMPAEVQNVIKTVLKPCDDEWGDITNRAMKIFLFSRTEVANDQADKDGKQYALFASKSSRKKQKLNGSGGIGGYGSWWLRSVVDRDDGSFSVIDYEGDTGWNYADTYDGVCFGFCI